MKQESHPSDELRYKLGLGEDWINFKGCEICEEVSIDESGGSSTMVGEGVAVARVDFT